MKEEVLKGPTKAESVQGSLRTRGKRNNFHYVRDRDKELSICHAFSEKEKKGRGSLTSGLGPGYSNR